MSIDREFLEILRCPVTGQPLRVLTDEELQKINGRIESGSVKYADETNVAETLNEGIITEDGETVYVIENGIPVMLKEKGIVARDLL